MKSRDLPNEPRIHGPIFTPWNGEATARVTAQLHKMLISIFRPSRYSLLEYVRLHS